MPLKRGIAMSEKKKVGRPKSKNVPYFPHYSEGTTELHYLENVYGAEGYRAFYRLLELLTKTNDHYIELKTEAQILTFRYSMKVEKEVLDKAIEYLVEMKVIDNHMYHEENIIWIPDLVDCFKLVYYKRGRKSPEKVGNKIVSDTRNSHYSTVTNKVTNQTKKQTKVVKAKTTTHYKNQYPDIDVDKSLKKLLAKNPNADDGDITRWLDSDMINGMNIKPPDFEQYETGLYKVFCAKCNTKGFANNEKDARYGESCCGVEWLPEPTNGSTS